MGKIKLSALAITLCLLGCSKDGGDEPKEDYNAIIAKRKGIDKIINPNK